MEVEARTEGMEWTSIAGRWRWQRDQESDGVRVECLVEGVSIRESIREWTDEDNRTVVEIMLVV